MLAEGGLRTNHSDSEPGGPRIYNHGGTMYALWVVMSAFINNSHNTQQRRKTLS